MKKKLIYNLETNTDDPVCGYKWGWSTINLMAGRTNSCHRVLEDDIPDDDFSNFHNTRNKIDTRKMMLNNKWPGKGCEYCRDIEAAGGLSDRLDFNSKEENLRFIPKELTKDNHAVRVSPTILEMYFSNLCNLGCVYCHPRYSSVLENESKKFKDAPWSIYTMDHRKREEGYETRLQSFWSWFKDNASSLKEYRILGGEPFFQPEFYDNLDYLEGSILPDLDLSIFSNLKIKKEKLRTLLERLERLAVSGKIRKVKIVCSIDCWGPQQEYVRYGLNMKSWEENFDMMVKEFPNVELELHGTITCLTIKTMPELIRRWKSWNEIRPEGISLSHNFCFSPDYYSPFIFGPRFFDSAFEEIYNILNEEKHVKYDFLLDVIKGYQKRINSTRVRDIDLIVKLKRELEKNDLRRNTDHRPLFQWIK